MFKTVIKNNDKEADVLEFSPSAIHGHIPEGATNFIRNQGVPANDFIMNELLAVKTGVKDREHQNYMKELERGVLEKLKEVQEPAYKEAYGLGLKDGLEKAYADNSQVISESLGQLTKVLQTVRSLKEKLRTENEGHIVQLIFHIAALIALKDINQSPDAVKAVLTKALQSAQADEEIRVRLNPKDAEFLQSIKGRHGDPLEKLPKVTIEPNANVSPGGCIIETNYGAIDATIETRVQEAWRVLDATVPKPEVPA